MENDYRIGDMVSERELCFQSHKSVQETELYFKFPTEQCSTKFKIYKCAGYMTSLTIFKLHETY